MLLEFQFCFKELPNIFMIFAFMHLIIVEIAAHRMKIRGT